jgi:SOS-response transcriptional repressor LexA
MLAIMHNAPAPVKCLLHHQPAYFFAMGGASARLKSARERSGYHSAKAAAEAMGVPVATYIQHENGGRGYPATRAERYAKFFRVPAEWLLFGKGSTLSHVELGPQLFVVGEVAAGVFREAWKWEQEDWKAFTGRSDLHAPAHKRFGLKVTGDSMDEIYPEGTILECEEYDGDYVIQSGKRVIVQRSRHDGSVESTVKELRRDPEGVEWLVPRSHNPMHQAFRGDKPDSPSIARVEIIAIVVAATRHE